MLPDRVSNPGPLTYKSGALPIALRGPAPGYLIKVNKNITKFVGGDEGGGGKSLFLKHLLVYSFTLKV